MNAKRRKLVDGTEMVWGIWVHLTGFVIGIPLCFLLAEIVEHLQRSNVLRPYPPIEGTAFSDFIMSNWPILLFVCFLLSLVLLRFHVWPPIKKLHKYAPSRDAFWAHCKAVGRKSRPYGMVFALIMALIMLPLPGLLSNTPILLFFGAEVFIARRRDRFIKDKVPDYLPV